MEHPAYHKKPIRHLDAHHVKIASFISDLEQNADHDTIDAFGDEWNKFSTFTDVEIESAGHEYFDIVNKEMLKPTSRVLDLGCGNGRWSYYVADRVGIVEAVDPGNAVFAAANLLRDKKNVRVTQASASSIPFDDCTFDFIICLGVLHHIPDTQEALFQAARKLKPGGYALLYFYYNLENRSWAYRLLFQVSNLFRKVIYRLPSRLRRTVCDLIAGLVYLPIVSAVRLIKKCSGGKGWKRLPLSYYANKSFRIMRNDALDRFGTPLEQRFTKGEIETMCFQAGLSEIKFSEQVPYWHLVARKK